MQQQLQLQAQQEEWMRQQLSQQQALLAQQQQEFLAAQAQQQARLAPQPTAFGLVPSNPSSFGRNADDDAQHIEPEASPPPMMGTAADLERNDGLCSVCQDEEANIAIVDCGYVFIFSRDLLPA